MSRIIRLTERDLTRIVRRVIKENEEEMGDMYTDFGRKKIPTKAHEDISYDIQSVDCGGKNGMVGHVDIDEDDTIIIRYCEGDNEELDYLKKKGKGLLYMKYGMNSNDAMKMVDDNQTSEYKYTSYGKPSKYDPQYSQDPWERYDHGGSQSGH